MRNFSGNSWFAYLAISSRMTVSFFVLRLMKKSHSRLLLKNFVEGPRERIYENSPRLEW